MVHFGPYIEDTALQELSWNLQEDMHIKIFRIKSIRALKEESNV